MKSKFFTLCLLTLFSGCFSSEKAEPNEPEKKSDNNSAALQQADKKTTASMARIKTIHGDILFKFFPDKAPNTVKRILELINEDFYNGLTFHRVVPGFVIQGGDPLGSGQGGSGKKLKAEFNDMKHVLGTVAMARAMDPDSADSQFYICLGDAPHLDGSYTVFGQVVEGLEVLPKIRQGDKMIEISLQE